MHFAFQLPTTAPLQYISIQIRGHYLSSTLPHARVPVVDNPNPLYDQNYYISGEQVSRTDTRTTLRRRRGCNKEGALHVLRQQQQIMFLRHDLPPPLGGGGLFCLRFCYKYRLSIDLFFRLPLEVVVEKSPP